MMPEALPEPFELPGDAFAVLPVSLALRAKVIPLCLAPNRTIRVATGPQSNLAVLETAALRLDYRVEIHPLAEEALDAQLSQITLGKLFGHGKESIPQPATTTTDPIAHQGSIRPVLEEILARAARAGVSDVHFEPGARHYAVRFRRDGLLQEVTRLASDIGMALASLVKVLAQLPVTENRLPLDGRFTLTCGGEPLDLRVSILPARHGPAISVRLFGLHQPRLDQLGMTEPQVEMARSELTLGKGMILICGPTGSGKTSTLHAFLRELVARQHKIISVEDPVERHIPGVTQIEVRAGGLGFAGAVRAILRHAPNVIAIGEIRDSATARVAAEAALSGHQVIATLHARDSAEALFRLCSLGVERHVIAETIHLLVSQRLIRLVCKSCAGNGCSACAASGYHGRTGLFSVSGAGDDLKQALHHASGAAALRLFLGQMGSSLDNVGLPY